ncbi:molecular chaperone DnaJ [Nostoc parmelioides]|uniref:Molecular chaperone DnaJ n=1 Tax=Nostoc parmelioides FACHB-3921 TaxID=2692909 RepID=A0ABR8BC83_9NOSO|nr:molecular chaperone DnaJ [Nostoc parmelioides]MBD2251433.1 molecular chaperone DnaJ [Nostoc parmelioides FACHB-3921]
MEQNPYDILGVSQAASKAEITKAVAVAMKRKQYPVDVIAKAQKSLMKPEERIIADYLRPILPPIKRFKYSDLSALAESAPTLAILPEFDGLEKAIAQATQEENQEREPLTIPLAELLSEGITACQERRYPKAIKYLEDYCHICQDRYTQAYIQAQMWLIRAYQLGGQLQRAVALCQMLVNHPHPQVQTWANKTLPHLSKEMSRV